MKLVLFLTLASTTCLYAQTQAPKPAPRVAASSFATVEVHVDQRPIENTWYAEDASLAGPARIAITYGQPHARGRKIEGGLIPKDTVWRFGSNMATALHSDVDLTLGNQKLPRGDYSLFIRNDATGWKLIVNRQTAQWGTDYDRSQDVARIPLTEHVRTDNEESLSIYLVPTSARPGSGYADLGGELRIKWGRTELTAPWQVIK